MPIQLSGGVIMTGGVNLIPSGSSATPGPSGASNYGYTSGGRIPSNSPTFKNTIDKFSFTSDGNATDVGDLSLGRGYVAGQSSTENGYTSGGVKDAPSPQRTTIDKFPFAADVNATYVSDLAIAMYGGAGQSSSDSGYQSGGISPAPGFSSYSNNIQKFPFASDDNATDVADLTYARYLPSGQSSSEYGYSSGGRGALPTPTIDKFPFASDANATDVGDLPFQWEGSGGQSSSSHGYVSGSIHTGYYDHINKFSFSSDGNASLIGTLSGESRTGCGQSSGSSGYHVGGVSNEVPWPGRTPVINKFPFASDANATDIGDLTEGREAAAGHQY